MKNTLLLSLLIYLCSFLNLEAQIFTHAESYEGIAQTSNLVVDPIGNTIFSGTFINTDTLEIGSFQLASEGDYDIFIAKRNPLGSILWAKSFGGPKRDFCYGLATDALGNVYISGNVNDTANILGVPVVSNFPGVSSAKNIGYVIKLDPLGSLVWLKTFQPIFSGNTSNYVNAWALTVGPNGDIYLNGDVKGEVQLGNSNINTNGILHSFLAKMSSSDGTYKWVQSFQSDRNPKNIATGNDGYIYCLYSFTNSIQAGGIIQNANTPGPGNGERLLVKWDTLGNFTMVQASLYCFNPSEHNIQF